MHSIHGLDMYLDSLEPEEEEVAHHQLVGKPSFIVDYSPALGGCGFRWLKENKSVQVHPIVLTFFGKDWASHVGKQRNSVDCYTEFTHKNGVTFRAHPNYQGGGPWYDWAMVRFSDDDGCKEDFPCRLLLFYRKSVQEEEVSESSGDDAGECEGTNERIYAVVQATTYRSMLGTEGEREENLAQTHLCTKWLLDTECVDDTDEEQGEEETSDEDKDRDKERLSIPNLYCVPIESIQENILVVEEEPGLCESWYGDRCVWQVKHRKTQWGQLYPLTFNQECTNDSSMEESSHDG